MRPYHVPALALALLPWATAAAAQTPVPQPQVALGAAAAPGFELYRFTDASQTGIDRVSLLTLPFELRTPLYGPASLAISGAYARGELTTVGGIRTVLSGLTDTQVALSIGIKPDVATVTAVALIPTGKSDMTANQAVLAGVVASELLPFRISNWGSGGGGGLSTALAHSFGAIGLGGSVAYLVTRQYDLATPGAFAYRPGNQLRARLALDAATGRAGKASLQLTYLHSGDDRFSGKNVFRAGDRLQALGSYAFAAGARTSGILYAGVLHRALGSYVVQLGATPASQNLVLAGGGARMPIGGAVFLPSVDVRVLRRADGNGDGEIVGLGGSLELPLGASTLVPSVRARLGRVLLDPTSESGFGGLDVGLGVRFGGGAR